MESILKIPTTAAVVSVAAAVVSRKPATPVVQPVKTPQISEKEKSVSTRDLVKAVRQANQQLERASNQNISFSYIKELNQLVVRVTDNASGQVIKEMPPRDLIESRIKIKQMIGMFLDRTG